MAQKSCLRAAFNKFSEDVCQETYSAFRALVLPLSPLGFIFAKPCDCPLSEQQRKQKETFPPRGGNRRSKCARVPDSTVGYFLDIDIAVTFLKAVFFPQSRDILDDQETGSSCTGMRGRGDGDSPPVGFFRPSVRQFPSVGRVGNGQPLCLGVPQV